MKRIIPLLLPLLLLTSCRPIRYIPVTTQDHSRDTIHLLTTRHDSIHLHDSIYITERQAGDTIYITTTKYQLRDRTQLIHDTIRQVHHDTITRPVTITATPTTDNTPRWWHYLRAIILLLMSALIINFVLHNKTKN